MSWRMFSVGSAYCCTLMLMGVVWCGCAVKEPASLMRVVSKGVPSGWSASKPSKAGVDARWVARFGDRRLTSFVDEALANNKDMKIAAERVLRAGEAARVAGALAQPQLGLNLGGNRQKINFIGFPFGGSQISESYGMDFKVAWEPDIWGRGRAGRSAAIAEWQAGGHELRAARASLAAQVCKAWFAVAEGNAQVVLAKEALRLRQKTESAVRDRFERDMRAEGGSAAQLRLAQVDVASAKAELSATQGEVELARRQLELLAGRYPSAKVVGRARLPRIPSSPPSGLPSELLLRRPDILAAERRYVVTTRRIKEAKLAFFPSFKMTGSSGTTTDALSQIINSDFGVWSIGASVIYPILTGGRIKSEVRVRRSNQREALAALQKTVLQAFGEVEQALASDRWLQRRGRGFREARDLARDAAQSSEEDYRDGNGDVLTLFAAQTRKIKLESQYLALQRMSLNNRVDLHLALGGGFTTSPQSIKKKNE